LEFISFFDPSFAVIVNKIHQVNNVVYTSHLLVCELLKSICIMNTILESAKSSEYNLYSQGKVSYEQ